MGIEPNGYENSSFLVSSSLKNYTYPYEHSSSHLSRSLKNETTTSLVDWSLSLELVNKPSFHPPGSIDPISFSLSSENFPISNQESILV